MDPQTREVIERIVGLHDELDEKLARLADATSSTFKLTGMYISALDARLRAIEAHLGLEVGDDGEPTVEGDGREQREGDGPEEGAAQD